MKNPAQTKTEEPKLKPKSKRQPKPQPNAVARPYIRPSVTEIFVSLQFHIVDRSVAALFVASKVEKLKNESAWVWECKSWNQRQFENESVHCCRCLFVWPVEPWLGPIPKRTSRAAKSAAVRPAHHSREDTRWQRVSQSQEALSTSTRSELLLISKHILYSLLLQLLLLVAWPTTEGRGGRLADCQKLLPQTLHGLCIAGDQSGEWVDQATRCGWKCKWKQIFIQLE